MGKKDKDRAKNILDPNREIAREVIEATTPHETGEMPAIPPDENDEIPRLETPLMQVKHDSPLAKELKKVQLHSAIKAGGQNDETFTLEQENSLYKIPDLPYTLTTEVFVLDTCYALNAEPIIQKLKGQSLPEDASESIKILTSAFPPKSFIVFPITVIEELDKIRKDQQRDTQIRATAREWYNGFMEISDFYGEKENDSVYILPNGSHLIFSGSINTAHLPSNDHRIMQIAFLWKKAYPLLKVIMCSDDLKVCLTTRVAKITGLTVQRHEIITERNFTKKFYVEVPLDNIEIQQKLMREGEILLSEMEYQEWMDHIYPHQILNFFTLHGRWCNEVEVSADTSKLIKVEPLDKPFAGLFNVNKNPKHQFSPGNREQENAVRFIMDKNIPITCLVGKAGSGKTCIAVAAALALLKPPADDKIPTTNSNGNANGNAKGKVSKKTKITNPLSNNKSADENSNFQTIIICRALEAVGGKEMGFLPGTVDDKINPWKKPILDNLELLLPCCINGETIYSTNELVEKGYVQFQPASYLRGRTIRNSIIIIDEAQNFSYEDLRTIITRNGSHSIIILTGDIFQVDIHNSGFYRWINKTKRFPRGAVVLLSECLRSDLANWAAEP